MRARSIFGGGAEFSPGSSLSDARVDFCLCDGSADDASGLDLLAVFAVFVGNVCFGAVGVLDDLWWWEREGIFLPVFGPVGASANFASAGVVDVKGRYCSGDSPSQFRHDYARALENI